MRRWPFYHAESSQGDDQPWVNGHLHQLHIDTVIATDIGVIDILTGHNQPTQVLGV